MNGNRSWGAAALMGAALLLAACTGDGEVERLRFGATAPPYALLFASYDGDGDGATTRAELGSGAAASWRLAAEGEETIRALAFQDWAQRAVGSRDVAPGFLTFDTNRDDRLTRTEFETGIGRVFRQMDRDGDGALTRAEMLIEARPLGGGEASPDPRRRRRG